MAAKRRTVAVQRPAPMTRARIRQLSLSRTPLPSPSLVTYRYIPLHTVSQPRSHAGTLRRFLARLLVSASRACSEFGGHAARGAT